jgi:RNA polymerase sigma factor (sigma-70 family)
VSTVPAGVHDVSDAELIVEVRNGDTAAYGALYRRHVASAYHLAYQLSRSKAEADDLVSEAFAKVLDTLRAGRGPDVAFRAYLLTALRHTAYDRTRSERRVELSGDVTTLNGVSGAAVSVPFADPVAAGLERSLAARAFARLPERWQAVLWHTLIEGQSPAEVAPLLGLVPNGVSALAYRAREGLRQAYLQAHLAETTDRHCRATTDRLGAWTRGGMSRREKTKIKLHLGACERCRALAAELADVNGALRSVMAPLILGPCALAYLLALAGHPATATSTSAVAAVTGNVATSSAAGVLSCLPGQVSGVAASAAAIAASVAIGVSPGADSSSKVTDDIQVVAPIIRPAVTVGAFASAAAPAPDRLGTPAPARDTAEPAHPVRAINHAAAAGSPGPAPDGQTPATVVHAAVVHIPVSDAGTCAKPVVLAVLRRGARPATARAANSANTDSCLTQAAVPVGSAVRVTITLPELAVPPRRDGSDRVNQTPGMTRSSITVDLPCPARTGPPAQPAIPSPPALRPSRPQPPATTPLSPPVAAPGQPSPTPPAASPAQQAATPGPGPDQAPAGQPPPPDQRPESPPAASAGH